MSMLFGQIINGDRGVEAVRFDGERYFCGAQPKTSWDIVIDSVEARKDLTKQLEASLDVPLTATELG